MMMPVIADDPIYLLYPQSREVESLEALAAPFLIGVSLSLEFPLFPSSITHFTAEIEHGRDSRSTLPKASSGPYTCSKVFPRNRKQ